MSDAWRVVEFRGRQGLLHLEADWRRLCASMPQRTAFHTFEAHLAYVDRIMTDPSGLRCLALRDGRQVRAICLLEERTDRSLGIPLSVWGIPAPPHLPLPDAIGLGDDAGHNLLPLIVKHLKLDRSGPPLLMLGPCPDVAPLWTGLPHIDRRAYCVDAVGSMLVLDCTRSFNAVAATWSKSLRRSLRREQSRLSDLADVRFVRAPETGDLAREFEAFLNVEGSGWKGASGTRTAVRFRKNQPPFFRDLLSIQGGEDGCEIDALYADGRCVAAVLGMRTGQEYTAIKVGYDERYARIAPGRLLLARLIERCCQDPRVARLNFASDQPWERVWRPTPVPLQRVFVALAPGRGLPLIALLRLRFGLGRRFVRACRADLGRMRSRLAEQRSPELRRERRNIVA